MSPVVEQVERRGFGGLCLTAEVGDRLVLDHAEIDCVILAVSSAPDVL
jgi:hypothetical protein